MTLVLLAALFAFLPGCSNDNNVTPGNATNSSIIELRDMDSPFGIHGSEDAPEDPGLMESIGIKWHRPGFHPGSGFPEKTAVFDNRYVKFSAKGINLLANLLVFRNKDGGCIPSDPEGMKAVVKQIVERYDGDGVDDAPAINGVVPVVRYWQIGNEVDIPGRPQSCTPQEYVDALKYYYPIIRENCYDCKIVMSGLVWDPTGYLDSVLSLGGGEYYDINDVHLFGGKDYYNYYATIPDTYKNLKEAQRKYGYDKEIWIIETGVNSGEDGGVYRSEEDQATVLVKVYTTALVSGFKKVFWAWGLHEGFGGDGNGFFDQTGLIYDGKGTYDKGAGVKKKAYYSYGVMTSQLNDVDFSSGEKLEHANKDVYVYRFSKKSGQGKVYVVWKEAAAAGGLSNPSQKTQISVSVDGSRAVVTYALTDSNGKADSYEQDVSSGAIELNLNNGPVFAYIT